MTKIGKKLAAVLLAVAMVVTFVPVLGTQTAYADTTTADYSAKLTFSDSAITETSAGSGYTIDGTTLTITAAGTYDITGSCSEGSIEVAKSLSGVTVILDNLTLSASSTAPVIVKKGTTANIHLIGTSTLTDNEDSADEDSSDEATAAAFEGAAIKVKSGSTVTFCGDGSLNVVANAKNGIKGGSTAALIFNQSGKISVSGNYSGYATTAGAVNNGIASDGFVTFNQGTFDIDAANDGIKSAPDATDTIEGTTIDTDSEGAVYINGGTFDIDVDGDGIQADTKLTIANGTFDITTMNGYDTSGTKYQNYIDYNGNENYIDYQGGNFKSDTMSCKGIKASGDRSAEIIEAGESTYSNYEDYYPTITITGGTFTLNCADDTVHSDAYAVVTGGTFNISSGDDGMHADTSLILGTENGTVERDPYVTINYSYEGLEGGTVYVYQGVYSVTAVDDGVNAAGGSDSSGDEPGGGGFNPGGGGPGGQGGFNPGGSSTSSSDEYNMYFYGGDVYVNCDGDGLDSNGGLYLYGGTQEVFSQSSGDNSALDADGTVSIDGATVFTAGVESMMDPVSSIRFGSNQKYKTYSSSLSSGKIVNATLSSTVLYSTKLPKAASYFMYSAPNLSGTPTLATANSLTACKGGSHSHSWNSGTVTKAATDTSTGLKTYTCSACGETETQTIPMTVSVDACVHSVEVEEAEDEGYTVTFAGDDGVASIVVYETQDTEGNSETISATGTAVSRNSVTGDPDSTGAGQVNFLINLNDGYSLDSVAATEGTYTNIKNISGNLYRITKITGDTTVTITTTACAHSSVADGSTPTWSWASDYSTATLAYTCGDCNGDVELAGTVTSELTNASTVTFTATAYIGETEYTDTKTATPFTGTFSTDSGVDSIDVYYTQSYDTVDDENADTAVARNGDTGCPVVSGDGQINFLVNLKTGYHIASVTADSNYKNIKGSSDTGVDNLYRVTKVTGDLTITVTTEACTYGDPVWTWADDYSSATTVFTCTDCGATQTVSADVTSSDDGSTVTYVATVTFGGAEYTDTQTVSSYGSDGTAYGAGATFKAVNAAITSLKSDADPAGTVYSKLRLRSPKQTNTSVKLSWNKVSGATKYVIYGNHCGKSNKMKKLATVTGKTKTFKKVAGKKVKKGNYYKFIVVALDKNNQVVSTSKIIHVASKGGKVCNHKKLIIKAKVNKYGKAISSYKKLTTVSLKSGKAVKLKVQQVKQYSSKKISAHRKIKYESSNTAVAKVSSSGKVTAVGSGTCYIYAYAQNGVYKRLKVTVK